jgi:hypothetical protein
MTRDAQVRIRAFEWLAEQTVLRADDLLEWRTLARLRLRWDAPPPLHDFGA